MGNDYTIGHQRMSDNPRVGAPQKWCSATDREIAINVVGYLSQRSLHRYIGFHNQASTPACFDPQCQIVLNAGDEFVVD